mgnify:CR=1 FL=1|jgi:hypothetical protein
MKEALSSKSSNPRRGRRKKKIPVDNLNIGDLFKLKHKLNLSDEKMCKIFDI